MSSRLLGTLVLAGLTLAAVAPAGAESACNPAFDSWVNHTFARVAAHLADGPQRIWVGTDGGGVLEVEPQTGAFERHARVADCLADNFVTDLAVDPASGDVWMTSFSGLSHLPGNAVADRSWTVFDPTNSPLTTVALTAVAVDLDGAVWVGSFDGGLFRFDGTAWTQFDPGNSGLSDPFVTSIEVDPAGDKWIGVWGDGVDRFDGTTWTNFNSSNTIPDARTSCGVCSELLSCPPDQLGLISVFVDVLGVDPVTGDVWFRNDDDGPCLLNGATRFDGQDWSTYTEQNSGLISNFVEDAAVDAGGAVWLPSRNGTSRLAGTTWTDFAAVRGLSVQPRGADVWLGTSDGLLRWDGQRLDPFAPEGLAASNVLDIAVEPTTGTAWIATGVGLHRFDGAWQIFDTTNTPLPNANAAAVELAADGAVWVGLKPGGVARFDGVDWTVLDPASGAPTNVTTLAEDSVGRIWAGWFLGALSRYDGVGWTPITTANSGIPSTAVEEITPAPGGDLWFATLAGAARFDGTDWFVYDVADGLPANWVRSVALHPDGDVWLGTSAGVSRFDGVTFENHAVLDNDIRTVTVDAAGNVWAGSRNSGAARWDGSAWTGFGTADGLVFSRVVSSAADPTGPVWLGTEFGISVYLGPLPGAPGEVPADGPPLTLARGPGPNRLTLAWGASCSGDATDYAVYRGTLGDFASHVPMTCSTSGDTSVSPMIQPGSAYFLVTARTAGAEGSYGSDGRGERRPASTAACAAPLLSLCP